MAVRKKKKKARRARSRKAGRRPSPLRRLLAPAALLVLAAGGMYTLWLDHRITSAFEGRRWAVPARIYARPLELYPGLRLAAAQLEDELKLIGYRPVEKVGRAGFFSRHGTHYTIHTYGFHFWDAEEPSRRLELDLDDGRIDALTVSSGDPSPLIRLEPAVIGRIYPGHNEDRVLIRLDDAPPLLREALLAVEDRGFYTHHGISLRGIARALWSNLKAGATVQGGSTLTQQLVKNYFLTDERTLTRKVNEALMALLLELRYSKDEILEAYLNEVYLGQYGKHAVHGFGLAALHYFSRPLHDLSLPEIATLVGLVRGASYYNPRAHPQRALARRNLVLDQLVEQGDVPAAVGAKAKGYPLGVSRADPGARTRFPAFIDLVRRQLKRDYRDDDLRSEGLQIHTTLDPAVQRAAERALAGVDALEARHKLSSGRLQGAVLVANPGTSEVLALVGDRHPEAAGFNRALDAERQVGSLIKPAVYLTALGRNGGYNPVSRLVDRPVHLEAPDGKVWEPRNFDRKEHGIVPLHQALAHSWNLATVRLGMDLGLRKVIHTLELAGIERAIPAYPSLLLGALNLTPFEVLQMYQTFANSGFRIPLRAIREVTGPDHAPLNRYRLSVSQEFDPGDTYVLNTLLQEAFRDGTGASVYRRLAGRPALAGKSGTTDDLRDSWYAGFGKDRLAVVWLGRDDNTPAGLTGSAGALQVWGDLMETLAPDGWLVQKPDDVEWRWADDARGVLTDQGCANSVKYPFLDGTEPDYESCSLF